MAGETTKSARLTNREDGIQQDARKVKGVLYTSQDNEAITTGELELADTILFDIIVPSNGIHDGCYIYNDDLDSNGTPALVLDIGLYASEKFTSTTSGTETTHAADAVLDADLLVDGSTEGQSANTDWTKLVPDSATFGPEDAGKPYWELLGYDEDPKTNFRVGVNCQVAAATAAAGDLALKIQYIAD